MGGGDIEEPWSPPSSAARSSATGVIPEETVAQALSQRAPRTGQGRRHGALGDAHVPGDFRVWEIEEIVQDDRSPLARR